MLEQALVIVSVTFLVMVTPGPDMVLVLRNTLVSGRRAGLETSAGILSGNLVHIIYCLLGIGLLISQSILAFSALKYAAAAYLIYLGIMSLRSGTRRLDPSDIEDRRPATPWTAIRRQTRILYRYGPQHATPYSGPGRAKRAKEGLSTSHGLCQDIKSRAGRARGWFVQGFVNNLLNPKGALFYLGVFTTVLTPETSASAMFLLIVSMMLVSGSFWIVFVYTLDRRTLRGFIERSQETVNRVFGVLLILLGLRVASMSR
jgi:threonine/homoserine/homoserine lactone efflux protein